MKIFKHKYTQINAQKSLDIKITPYPLRGGYLLFISSRAQKYRRQPLISPYLPYKYSLLITIYHFYGTPYK